MGHDIVGKDTPSTDSAKTDSSLQPASKDDGGVILERILPFRTNRLAYRMNQLLKADLKPFGLSIVQWRVLAVLSVNEQATINELTDYGMVEQPTMSRIIDGMVDEGLLDRRNGNRDGRVRAISLTEKGWEKYQAVQKTAIAHTRRVLDGLNPEERVEFSRLLQKMTDNIS